MTEYVTEQNQNALNEEYDAKMTRKYEGKIKDGYLQIGDLFDGGDPEVTSLRFLEKFNIQTLKLNISSDMSVKLRSNTLKKLNVVTYNLLLNQNEEQHDDNEDDDEDDQPQRLNMQVDDLELENLEVLKLENNKLENNQLYNLAKFKKLHTLNVSDNKIDLTHIHIVRSLTNLSMRECGLKNIDLISSLVNLEELDLSLNRDIDLNPLRKLKSLTTLYLRECGLTRIDQITSLVNLQELDISLNEDLDLNPLRKLKCLTTLYLRNCGLTNIDQIALLINLEVLDIAYNQLLTINSLSSLVNLKQLDISSNYKIDITSLKDLVGLIKLNMQSCNLRQLSALKSLINLQHLDFSYNPNIIITELQYLRNLTHLNLKLCNLVSVYVLRPLVNLEVLHISYNNIVHLDANLDKMKNLEKLSAEGSRISNFSSLEKHPNYNNLDEKGKRCFEISYQRDPSEQQLCKANKFRKIERPNIQLKEIQNQHKALKTTLQKFKKQLNAVMNNARQSQIQFTANMVRLFQQLNQFGFE
ncbi:leucine-rich_repeat domain-containing protein [Hexamita inflata]|uniref:Leucine-rich repeat domain-containing protein n=1 Tax=Hexamita inflata TaxID=28002 RepID=A0AA86PLY9_9EUKA|nr:leucine-rich repeat domain-containing protein [Hexamita inflata]